MSFSKKHKKRTKSKFSEFVVKRSQHTAAAHDKHGQDNAGQGPFVSHQHTPQHQTSQDMLPDQ